MTTTDMIVPMLTKMREDMNARFDSIEARFDRRFDAMEGRIEQLEHHAAVTNSKLDTLTKRLEHVEVVCEEGWAQVASTAAFSSRFEQRMTSELAELRARVSKLETKDRE